MSTLRTTNIIHGSSSVSNIVLDNQGRAIFGPDSPQGRAALYVNAQNNRVGVNTETPAVALDVAGAINATGNVAFGGTLDVTGLLTSNGNLLVNGTLNVTDTGTFGNNVSSVGYFGAGGNPSGGSADGTRIYAGGGCTASTGTGTNQIWRGYTTGNSSTTSSILANGESTFQGDMTISRVDPGNDVFLRIKNNTGTDAGTLCSLRLSTSPGSFDTCVLQADRSTGSTSFYYGTTRTLQLTSAGALKTGAGLYDSLASDGGIDAGSGLYSLVIGGNSGGGSNQNEARVNNGNKEGRVVLCHRTNAEEPVGLITAFGQGTQNLVYIGGGSSLVNAATEIGLYTATNNTTTAGTKRVTINESGQVLVGTDTGVDAPLLIVQGYKNIPAGEGVAALARGGDLPVGAERTTGVLRFTSSDGSRGAEIASVTEGPWTSGSYPARLTFATTVNASSAPTTRMTIDNTGRILVGTTSSVRPNAIFQIKDDVGQTELWLEHDNLADTEYCRFIAVDSGVSRSGQVGIYKHAGIANPAGFIYLQCADSADRWYWTDDSDIFRCSANTLHIGTTNGTVVGTQTSDKRLKNVGENVSYGLTEVLQLQPKQYTLKSQPDTNKLGFIAQEVESIIPEAVFDTSEELEGHQEGDRTKLGMEYVQLIPVLVNAIKEQQAAIIDLQTKLTAIENTVNN